MMAPPILTSKPIESKEVKKAEMTLNFQNDIFQLSLFRIDNNLIRFNLSFVNNQLNQYQKEFNFDNFIELNKIFKIYDNIEEIEADLINYFNEKKIKISEIKETEAILSLSILASKDNIIYLILNKKSLDNSDKINILFEELEQKDKRIVSLENALNESNKIIKGLQEEIKKINKIFKEQMNDDTSKKNKNSDLNFDYLQIFLNFNFPSNFKKFDSLYDIYFFPNSKNKIFLSNYEMNIYKPNMELIKSMETEQSKYSLCIIDDNLIAYAEKEDIKFYNLNNKCEFSSIKKAFYIDIYKIIKGFNENEIIAIDTEGIIKFWEANKEEKKFIQIKNKTIISPNSLHNDTNILLVDDILVVGSDKLYFYDINKITPIVKKKKSDDENSDYESSDKEETDSINSGDFDSLDYSDVSYFKFQPEDYNSMILLDKKEKLFAVKGTIPTEIKEIEYEDINEKKDLNCEVLLVGDLGVGKSSLIQKLDKNIFDGKSYLDSFLFSNLKIKMNNIIIEMNISKNIVFKYSYSFNIDTLSFFDIYVLIYSINNEESFKNIKSWLIGIRKHNNNAKIILVGNKSDLENERVITKEMGMKFKEENNLEVFIETSAKNDDIKKVLITEIVNCFYENREILFPKVCVLKINNIDEIKLIKYFYEKYTAIGTFKNKYLLLGLENGDIKIYDIKKKFDLVRTIKKAHNKKIYFIKQISDNSIASYGEDEYYKEWNLDIIMK